MISNSAEEENNNSAHPLVLLSNSLAKKEPKVVLNVLNFNFEEWYCHLSELQKTSDGQFRGFWAENVKSVELSLEEMCGIVKCYLSIHNQMMEEHESKEDCENGIQSLKHKLDELLKMTIDSCEESWFVRCGPRSPKDCRGGIPEIFLASQIINLLCESKRVYKDIQLYLDNKDLLLENHKFNYFVHLIPWRSLKTENELRCFFFRKTLVAITQYDNQLPYVFKGNEFNCVRMIQKLMNMQDGALKKAIPYENFVMDVEVSIKDNTIYVIEFNPYGKYGTTGAVHFDWEKDYSILNPQLPNMENQSEPINYETIVNVHFRFTQNLISRVEQVIVPPLSHLNQLDNISIQKKEKKIEEKISIPLVSNSFLDFL